MPAADEGCGKGEPAADVVDSQPDERVPRGVIGAAEGGFQGIHVVGGETVDLVVQSPKALEPPALPGAAPDGLEVIVEGADFAGGAPEQAREEFIEQLLRVLVRVPPELGCQPDLRSEAGPVGIGFGVEAFDAGLLLELDVVGHQAREIARQHPAQAVIVVLADVVALLEP